MIASHPLQLYSPLARFLPLTPLSAQCPGTLAAWCPHCECE
jgi:hypothetical protein